MHTMSIDHGAVLDEIYTFLLDHGYTHTIRTLQLESRRPFNTLVSRKGESSNGPQPAPEINSASLHDAVLQGKWDVVLQQYLSSCILPEEKLFPLFEHIFSEMLHVFEVEQAARSFFHHSPVFKAMKRHSPAQHARLAQTLQDFRPNPNLMTVDDGSSIVKVPAAYQERRQALADDLVRMIRFVTRSELSKRNRLPWAVVVDREGYTNTTFTPSGTPEEASARKARRLETSLPTSSGLTHEELQAARSLLARSVQLQFTLPAGGKDVILCNRAASIAGVDCAFFGTSSGQVWWVAKSLAPRPYLGASETGHALAQELEPKMFCAFAEHGVMSFDIDFGSSSTDAAVDAWLAVGYRGGVVRVYDIHSGKLARKFTGADALAVHSLTFCGLPNQLRGHRAFLLTAGMHGTLSLLSIEQGTVMHQVLSPHNGHICRVVLCSLESGRGECFVTTGDDAIVRVWQIQYDTLRVVPCDGSSSFSCKKLEQLHPAFISTVPTCLGGGSIATGPLKAIIGIGTRCGKLLCLSIATGRAVFAADFGKPVHSVDVVRHFQGATASADDGLLAVTTSTNDGLVHTHVFNGNHTLSSKSALVGEPDATTTCVADALGGVVEELTISTSWASGERSGCFVASSSHNSHFFVCA